LAVYHYPYCVEFDYYKPSGTVAANWQIFGVQRGNLWSDVRIMQSDERAAGDLLILYGCDQVTAISDCLPTDRWTHFLISNNGNGSIEIYIDGNYKGTFNTNVDHTVPTIRFGCFGAPSGTNGIGEGYWRHFQAYASNRTATICTTAFEEDKGIHTIRITTSGSSLEFDAYGDGYSHEAVYPGFTEKSTIRSVPLMDTHPDYHVGGLRKAGKAYGGTLHSHHPFRLKVLKVNRKIVAFQTVTQTEWNPLQATSTYYIFEDLPEVIYIDTELERIIDRNKMHGDAIKYSYGYQLYARGFKSGDCLYNGIRMWFEDPNPPGIPWYSGTGFSGYEPYEPDGTDGVFLYYKKFDIADFHGVYWNPQKLTRGLGLQQKDGINDMSRNPYVGYIFDVNRSEGHFANANEDYYGIVPIISTDPVPHVGDKASSQLLLFFARENGEIANLSDIYNLEESVRFPLQQEPLILTEKSRPQITFKENHHLARRWQIILMPAEYASMIPRAELEGNVYLGKPKPLALLQNVSAGAYVTIGELPIVLSRKGETSYFAESNCLTIVREVTIVLTLSSERKVRAVVHDGEAIANFEQRDVELRYTTDVRPGFSSIQVQFA
jgi:hypothetical protein